MAGDTCEGRYLRRESSNGKLGGKGLPLTPACAGVYGNCGQTVCRLRLGVTPDRVSGLEPIFCLQSPLIAERAGDGPSDGLAPAEGDA